MSDAPDQSADDLVAQAIINWQSTHDEWGPNHELTLTALLALASARWSAGDSLGAVRDADIVLAGRRETLGAEHPSTLPVAGLVGIWHYVRGDAGALEELRELVPVMIRVLGAEHPDTLWAAHTLAAGLDGSDDPAGRLVRWVQLCGAETRAFGPRHELTLSAAYGVAVARHALGDPFGASADALVVVGYRRRLLGEHHPDTLAAQLSRLSWMCEAQGCNDHTLKEFDELIVALQNAVGHDHEHTLVARYNRARWTPETFNEIERISEWEVIAEDLARVFGEQHPVSLGAVQALAAARAEWEDSLNEIRNIAFDLYVDAESEDRGIDVMPGRDWMNPGNLDEDAQDKVAEDADEQRSERADLMEHATAVKKALAVTARTRGNDDIGTLQWRYYLAWWLWQGHEFDPAGQRARKLIDDCVRLLGDDHPLTGATRALEHHITNREWAGLSPFWDGSASI